MDKGSDWGAGFFLVVLLVLGFVGYQNLTGELTLQPPHPQLLTTSPMRNMGTQCSEKALLFVEFNINNHSNRKTRHNFFSF
jgi:hypothetical protein